MEHLARERTVAMKRGAAVADRIVPGLAALAVAGLVASTQQFAFADAASDAAYPNKPVRLVVPQSPGSATDVLIRIFAPKFGEMLGQSMVVDNRSGAGGIIGAEGVAKAVPDGYTLLVGAAAWVTIAPHIYRKPGYDPVTDFAPVSQYVKGCAMPCPEARGRDTATTVLTTGANTAPPKPSRVIRAAELSPTIYLETEAEVEAYVAKLKAELLKTIHSGKRARIS
jgi:hypothetical protein